MLFEVCGSARCGRGCGHATMPRLTAVCLELPRLPITNDYRPLYLTRILSEAAPHCMKGQPLFVKGKTRSRNPSLQVFVQPHARI